MYIYLVASVTQPFSGNCVCIDCVRGNISSDFFEIQIFSISHLTVSWLYTYHKSLALFPVWHTCLVSDHKYFQSVSLMTLLFVVDHVEARCLCVQLVLIIIFQFPASSRPLTFRQWLWYYNVIPSSFGLFGFWYSPLEAMILLSDVNNRIALL